MLILDYIMSPIHGDEVVAKIREFNKDIYILLLTGHKDLAPPLETIKALDIQGYCEKGDKFDQLLLLIESGIKSISQMRTIRQFKDGFKQNTSGCSKNLSTPADRSYFGRNIAGPDASCKQQRCFHSGR